MRRDEIRKVAREAFERLIRDVEEGVSDTLKSYLKATARFHRCRVGNAILIQLQKSDATHVAGFRAWQRLGRHVKKGEHRIAIMAPVVYRKKPRKEATDKDEAGDEVLSTFKTAYVFDISQTEGGRCLSLPRSEAIPVHAWQDLTSSLQAGASNWNAATYGLLRVCRSGAPSS